MIQTGRVRSLVAIEHVEDGGICRVVATCRQSDYTGEEEKLNAVHLRDCWNVVQHYGGQPDELHTRLANYSHLAMKETYARMTLDRVMKILHQTAPDDQLNEVKGVMEEWRRALP